MKTRFVAAQEQAPQLQQHQQPEDPGPPFAVLNEPAPNGVPMIFPAAVILARIDKIAEQTRKMDITAGPVFRELTEAFIHFVQVAEPGQMFHAPEIGVCLMRASQYAPRATAWSKKARAQMKAQKEEAENGKKIVTAGTA